LEFRRSGYRSSRETVSFDGDHKVTTVLAKAAVAERPKPAQTGTKPQNEKPDPNQRGTTDPFAE
jgi:hypothetical protein